MGQPDTRTCTVCKTRRPLDDFQRTSIPGHGPACRYCRRPNLPMAERFWAKVNIAGSWDCWEWQAGRFEKGYGQFKAHPRRSPQKASRIAWLLTYGDPGELHVLHHCDNPPCCNPRHLFLGTQADNALDCRRKGRSKSGAVVEVLVENVRRLTDAQIAEVRARAAAGESGRSIARSLPVHHTTVNRLINGTHWVQSA